MVQRTYNMARYTAQMKCDECGLTRLHEKVECGLVLETTPQYTKTNSYNVWVCPEGHTKYVRRKD